MFRNTIKSCRFILSSSTTNACSSTRASARVFRCSFANKPATAAKLKAQMRPAFQELGEEALPNEKPSESIMKKAISPYFNYLFKMKWELLLLFLLFLTFPFFDFLFLL